RKHEEHWVKNVHRQLQPGVYMYIENFSKKDSIGYKFTLEKFNGMELAYKISGERISWNQETGSWQLESYVERRFTDKKEQLEKGDRKDLDIAFNPKEFFLRKDDVGIYNSAELDRIIAEEKMRGAEKI